VAHVAAGHDRVNISLGGDELVEPIAKVCQ
jgi:hypothetical protein